jgi:hypothetical protein
MPLFFYPPIITVGQPATTTPPWPVASPILTAGLPAIKTEEEPTESESGGPVQTQLSPTMDAGKLPINTLLLAPGIKGPPTCGTVPVVIGHVCISVILAAAAILI